MRIFEIIVILLSVITVILSMFNVKNFKHAFYILLGLFLLFNLIFEGLRYEVLSLILTVTIIGLPTLSFIRLRRIFSIGMLILMLSLIF
ncbi:MAG: hypothetical protein ACPG2Y_02535, partial [Acholeplasmataceae bacterium]